MIDLSLITLKIITKIKKIKVNVRWTIFLVLEFSSSDFWFLLMPKISIQKEEVSAVIAPSAEGKSAEISPRRAEQNDILHRDKKEIRTVDYAFILHRKIRVVSIP